MDIVHIDSEIIVAAKPSGMLAVPGRGPDKQDCLSGRLRVLFPDLPKQPAVHRLDMSTSGLMVFARNGSAHRRLSRQFELRQVKKEYEAVVEGNILKNEGIICLAFRLDINNRPLQIYDPDRGKMGITLWKKLGKHPAGTRICFSPQTGRTHQLRVHAAHPLGLHSPIVGDFLYGSGKDGDRLLLHATKLCFFHPQTGKKVFFTSSSPF